MARLEKRDNVPTNSGSTVAPLRQPERCGICKKAAIKRLKNAWREIDICGDQNCFVKATKWVGNMIHIPIPAIDRHQHGVLARQVEHKLTKKSNPKPVPIGPHSRSAAAK